MLRKGGERVVKRSLRVSSWKRRVHVGIALSLVVSGATAAIALGQRGSTSVDPGQALLASLNASIAPDVIVHSVATPVDFAQATSVTASWLEADLPANAQVGAAGIPAEAVREAQARWHADLVIGAYRDKAAASALPSIGGATYMTGSKVTDVGLLSFEPGTLTEPTGQALPLATDQTLIRDTISAAAQAAGVTIQSLTFVQGIGPAPVVELVSSDPAALVRSHATWLSSMVGAGKFTLEGWFIVARDAQNVPFYVSAVSSRAGDGTAWVRDDLVPVYASTR